MVMAPNERHNKRHSFIVTILSIVSFFIPIQSHSQEKLVEFGDFEEWIVRDIKESRIVGGNVERIYAVGPTDTMIGNTSLSPDVTIWGSSNAFAKIIGVIKTSMSVQPEDGPSGRCARLQTCYAECKALGIINIKVLAGGSLFWGYTLEPISNPYEPYKNIVWGIPFTEKPQALIVDYKSVISTDNVITRCTPFTHSTYEGKDSAEILLFLQHRWEDEDGNIYAKRVGTSIYYIEESTDGWIFNHRMPIIYGDATQSADYKPYMDLRDKDDPKVFYYLNKNGDNVPVEEIGWAEEDELPTHAVLTITSGGKGAYEGAIGNILWVDNVRLE